MATLSMVIARSPHLPGGGVRGGVRPSVNRGGPPPGCRPRQVIVPGDSGPAARAAAPPLPTWPAAPGGIRRPDCAGAGPLMNPCGGRRAVQARPP